MAAALASTQVAYVELEEARLSAERASNTDPLTGLANRRSFQRSLDAAIHGGRGPFGLLLLDVDHFKRANDTHGHQAGDDVLVGVVERMRAMLPDSAIVAPLGRRGVHRAPVPAARHPRRAAFHRRGHPAAVRDQSASRRGGAPWRSRSRAAECASSSAAVTARSWCTPPTPHVPAPSNRDATARSWRATAAEAPSDRAQAAPP